MVFDPTVNPTLIGEPEATVVPFTVTIAVGSGVVGVTLMDENSVVAV